MSNRLEPLLNPSSIALIGASNNPGRIGGMPLDLLTQFGYQGDIYPINPKYDTVFGITCLPEIEQVPKAVDLAVLAIGANDVLPMLKRCHKAGAKAAIVYAAGFAEEGSAASIAKQEAIELFAKESGMIIAGPNCMGFANLNTQAHTAFASVFKSTTMQTSTGSISLLTQSGNVCAAVYALLRQLDLPVSHFINTGNEACVTFSDYLSYLAQDPNTETIIGYIEELRDGQQFIESCQILREKNKLLIALKAGSSEKGAIAVQSHTSALAGDRNVYKAAFKQLGVIEASDFAQMAQLAYLAQFKHKSAGKKIAIITMSGALGAILTDQFSEAGLDIPDLSAELQVQLRANVPDYGMVSNPIDVTGNVVNDPEFVLNVLESLAVTSDIDCVIIYAPGYMLDRMADSLIKVAQAHSRLFVAIDTGIATTRQQLHDAGVPVFTDIGRAVSALSPFLLWQEEKKHPIQAATTTAMASTKQPISLPTHPTEVDSLRYLAQFGIASNIDHIATSKEQAIQYAEALGFPVVLKVVSADIPHKTEVNGVQLNINSINKLEQAYDAISQGVATHAPKAKVDGVLVQRQQNGIAELIVGITQDPTFGPTLTLGLGGTLTEIYKDTSHALLPVDTNHIIRMLKELKAFALLDGFRGRPKADLSAIANAVMGITQAYQAGAGAIKELEVNPLLVNEKGAVALDALMIYSTE